MHRTNEATRSESEFPAYWDFGRDGLACEGRFVRLDEGPSAYGRKPIVVLDVEGEERAIWVTTAALRSKLGDELGRRRTRDFQVGERIVITRAAEQRESATTGRRYWPFAAKFPDAPKRDAAAVLGTEPGEESPLEDDDLPF